jgi:hypothetical protein
MDGVLGILNGKGGKNSGGKNSGGPTTYIVSPPVPVSGDLDIIDSNGATVGEDKEESPGGWVSVNNDNDNYNFHGNQATSTLHKYNVDENAGAGVERENDLIEIRIKDTYATTGYFTLEWNSTKIRVWGSPEKGGADEQSGGIVIGSLGSDAYASFWVEGKSMSNSMAAEEIKLVYHDDSTPELVDKVNFTVYKVEGVLNVPGYSIHKYKATSPVNGLGGFTPTVLDVSGGTKKTEVALGGVAPVVMETTVLWGAGAEEGKVRITPGTAVSNFYVNREVNVVKFEYESEAGADNKIIINGTPVQANVYKGGDPINYPKAAVRSTNVDDPAMEATIKVKSIAGPVINGEMRGLRFVETGLIQFATASKVETTFVKFDNGIQYKNVADYSGERFVDTAIGSTLSPYYHQFEAYYSPDGDPPPEGPLAGPIVDRIIKIRDTPQIKATTNAMTYTNGGQTVRAEKFDILINFEIYICVRTRDGGLGSDKIYTKRGSATWYFNGTGHRCEL